jgi:protein-S-isoprenylcysteine O-methyltransferase Ste14
MTVRVLYGAVFVVVLPAGLVVWSHYSAAAVTLPVPEPAWAGWVAVAIGLAFTALGMILLWLRGGGLPMNAFPPRSFVATNVYRWIPHPIYTGFCLICGGVAMAARSASGFWLVTPAAILGCAALVLGYERLDLRARFGSAAVASVRLLPADGDGPPTWSDRARFLLSVLLPWMVLYGITTAAGVLPGAHSAALSLERNWPVWSWTYSIYASLYPLTLLVPFLARSTGDLRRLSTSIWMAIAIVYPAFFLFPVFAPHRSVIGSGVLAHALILDQRQYLDTAVFPAFHAIWAILITAVIWRQGASRLWGCLWAAAVAVSCVTTGMHNVADVVAAFAVSLVVLRTGSIWQAARGATECIANSWREWRLGPVRVINHALYGAAAATVGLAIVGALLGPGHSWELLCVGAGGLLGAAIWAQVIEGSARLLRPFGFYGGLLGVFLVALCFSDRWQLLAVCCVAAPWIQGIGRLRCLVQGCCHGGTAPESIGIRYRHPRSRVFAEGLAGQPIHATPLYSILWCIVMGLLVLRLWTIEAPYSLIIGIYGIVSGAGRFVEEAYRGEPQTPVVGGLRLYQWIAAGLAVLGAAITCLPSGGSSFSPTLSAMAITIAVAFGVVSGAALGVDFPGSNRRFSRLAPAEILSREDGE